MPAYAEEPDSSVQNVPLDEPMDAEKHARQEKRAARGYTWAVLPGAFYQQETSLGLALFGTLTFDMKDPHPDTWPSTVTATAVYTLQNQASFTVWANLYFGPANLWGIESAMFLEHFPTNYYGIGPSSLPNHQVYTRRQARSDLTVRRRIHDSFFLGLAHHTAVLGVRDVVAPSAEPWGADDRLDSGTVPGGEGNVVHGVGALARWDSRDNNQSTKTGLFVDLELAQHPTFLGSTGSFGYTRLDVRGFVPLGPTTFGLQSLTQVGWGAMPFTSMFELGGDRMLRGMYQGRFRDRTASTLQAELRVPIVWRFSAVAFAGSGHVAPTLAGLFHQGPRWTAGGGARFELDPDNHTNIRLDVGAGPDGTGFIFTFGEAF